MNEKYDSTCDVPTDSISKPVRYYWVDVAKAICIIFVYIGHWKTVHLTAFAYSFHIFLFFVISGFFAKSSYRQPVRIFIINKLLTLALPLFLWAFISTVIQFLDSSFYITDLTPVFENPASIQPNYWFFSCLLSISITFYFLLKLLKKPWIILCGALVLNLLFGEWSLVPEEFNPFLLLAKLPVLSTISNWFSFHGIAVYLFWYALGATIFPLIKKWLNNAPWFHGIGGCATALTVLLMLNEITKIDTLDYFIFKNDLINESINDLILGVIKIIITIIMSTSILYISRLMEGSTILRKIGKNTMSLMGLEYITHNIIPLIFLPLINLGIPNITSSISVLIIVALQLAITVPIALFLGKYFPVLNGKIKIKARNSLVN